MTYRGRVQGGVIVLEGPDLPREGALVRVEEETFSAAGRAGIGRAAGKPKGVRTGGAAKVGGNPKSAKNGAVRKNKRAKRGDQTGCRARFTRDELASMAQKHPAPRAWFAEPECDLTKPERP